MDHFFLLAVSPSMQVIKDAEQEMFDKPVFLVLFAYQGRCGFPLKRSLFATIFLMRRGVRSPQKAILHLLGFAAWV
jgi:hypothetical protein